MRGKDGCQDGVALSAVTWYRPKMEYGHSRVAGRQSVMIRGTGLRQVYLFRLWSSMAHEEDTASVTSRGTCSKS